MCAIITNNGFCKSVEELFTDFFRHSSVRLLHPLRWGIVVCFEMTHSISVTKVLYFRSSDAYSRMIISIRKILEVHGCVMEEWADISYLKL